VEARQVDARAGNQRVAAVLGSTLA